MPSEHTASIPHRPPIGSVPRARWGETLADFSQRHRGWLLQAWALPTAVADTSTGYDGGGRRELAAGVPLHGVELATRGAVPAIVVHVCDEHGNERGQPLLRIDLPRALALERTATGDVAGLRIDDASGHTTWLHFRTTASPESLDGLAETEL
jgi:hypothetical protein